MTVKELIEELKKFDENLPVKTSDSEYGDEDISSIDIREIKNDFVVNESYVRIW